MVVSFSLTSGVLVVCMGNDDAYEWRTPSSLVIEDGRTAPSPLLIVSPSSTPGSETIELGLEYEASWIAEGNQADAFFGYSVASAGDVNGDGYCDVIVGAPLYSVGGGDEGRAYLYLGSFSGLSATPSWTADGADGGFGHSVASAGDVNGDGFDDVVVGEPGYDGTEINQGRAALYLGSPSGLIETLSWSAEGDQAFAVFGNSVSSAGDVNHDGYCDILIGAPGSGDEGRVYLFEGSDSGLSTVPSWIGAGEQIGESFGRSVASAGDVNNDGYDDVIIGSDSYENGEPFEGRAYLYLGSPSGLDVSSAWTIEGNQIGARFGSSVGSAGDVNGDDFDDVVIGAYGYDNGELSEGRAYLYLGSASGLPTTSSWTAEGNEDFAQFGFSVASAGDVNDDGYDDVIVGSNYDEGRAFLYPGSSTGLSTTSLWVAEGNQTEAHFGFSVASAGDVNGDGYDEVVVGANLYDNGEIDEGRAYLYMGSTSGLYATPSWNVQGDQVNANFGWSAASAGDVNGDGYDDVIVMAPLYDNYGIDAGRTYLYLGSTSGLSATPSWIAEGDQAGAWFGYSAASAGDVNGDGYDDVVVGANGYDGSEENEGRAYLYMGSASGLSATPSWTTEGDQLDAYYGGSVASAGDVNGDSYDDVVVGARLYDNGEEDEGRAYLFLGSISGLSATPSWTTESNQSFAWLGSCVASAGDVNGDGCDDVVVGVPLYDNGETDEGCVNLYLGSTSGLSTTPSWVTESNQADADLGRSVAPAGDVNGDGYDDVVVGACWYDNGEDDEGRAYLYLGSASGLPTTPSWASESDQIHALFGNSVASAGDVNGDGYDDVVIGAPLYDNYEIDKGRASLYLGSISGLSPTPSWNAEGNEADVGFGISVQSAGDVDGDGFDDVVIGASYYPNEADEGHAYLYLGYGDYQVTFDQTGLDSDATGAVLMVDGESWTCAQLPHSIWVGEGSTISYCYGATVSSTTVGKLYSLVNVSGPSSPITVTGEVAIVGNYDCPPTACAGPDQSVDEDVSVSFDGSGSYNFFGTVNYTWTFMDGTEKVLYGISPIYTFEDPEEYTVTLSVSDVGDNHDTDTVVITVRDVNEPPVADAGDDQAITVGEEVTFGGSDSSDDVGIENYTWAFMYDNEGRELYGVSPTFTFDIAGEYEVRLTVEDAEGATDTDTVTITVEEEEDEEEDGKSFIEQYGLALGVIIALIVIALILFFVLKGRRDGKAPTIVDEMPGGQTEVLN